MRVSLRIFWTPKRGNTTEEYEDAYWPPEPLSLDSKLLRFAVADGATETSFAGSWARILARAYCRDQMSSRKIRKVMPRLAEEWLATIEKESLPWYAEEKLSQGAFATLTGLTLFDGGWESSAIGDSSLFQVRDGRVITAFPMTCARDFNNHPGLLSSNNRRWENELGNLKRASGEWELHDDFYLMTDAMACWFLDAVEAGQSPPDIFDKLDKPEQGFDEWVESLRSDYGMRNDDVTLLKISVG
jgi:hypothetical protein